MEDAKYVSSMCIGSGCSIVFDNNGNSEISDDAYDEGILIS